MLNDKILRELGALTRTINLIANAKFKKLNLQIGQSIYLTRICENPGINLIELSHMLVVDKTCTTKVVKKLVKGNLVIKKKDENDKRYYHLFPTKKAKSIYEEIISEENRQIEKCYKGFNKQQQRLIIEMIKKMRKNLSQ